MHRLIGAASGWGAQIHECEEGPDILKDRGLLEELKASDIPVSKWKMLYPEKRAKDGNLAHHQILPIITAFNTKLAKEVEMTLREGEFPVVLGGDHSVAVGSWNGAYQYFQEKGELPIGLIWIDAHMDSHTPQTTPSGAYHGMPLASLLGHGEPMIQMHPPISKTTSGVYQDLPLAALLGYGDPMIKKKQKEPVLFAKNICLIGTRSYEEGEAKLLEELNVRIFFSKEVKEKGMEKVMKEAIAHITRDAKVFGVSLDLDVISFEEAPGVGSPEAGGISKSEILKGISLLPNHPQFKLFEMAEYNPKRNHHAMTAKLCYEILTKVLKTS